MSCEVKDNDSGSLLSNLNYVIMIAVATLGNMCFCPWLFSADFSSSILQLLGWFFAFRMVIGRYSNFAWSSLLGNETHPGPFWCSKRGGLYLSLGRSMASINWLSDDVKWSWFRSWDVWSLGIILPSLVAWPKEYIFALPHLYTWKTMTKKPRNSTVPTEM